MKDSARYAKIVAWSDEDQCFIGYAPGLLIGGCCHGDDEKAVFAELCEIVDETIEIDRKDGLSLPPPTAGFDYCDILQDAVKSREAMGALEQPPGNVAAST